MPRDCPTCSNALRGDSCPSCGWSEKRAETAPLRPVNWGLCEYTERGLRCGKPGTVSRSTVGPHTWYCFDHAFPSRTSGGKAVAPPVGWRRLGDLRPMGERE